VEQFQIPAEAAGVRLTAELPQECLADVDRVQIERMITNLLSNALKFTPEGGQVTMSLQVQPTFVEMVVEDNGRGIPTEHLPHIFDRFYRVPGKGTAPSPEQGLGLGLSFVAWIVKAHNGKIEVESTPGKERASSSACRMKAWAATRWSWLAWRRQELMDAHVPKMVL
jgi:signal transduction histidine kinase